MFDVLEKLLLNVDKTKINKYAREVLDVKLVNAYFIWQ